jgi:ATP-binding cassette, subfamily B, bacterial
MRDYKRAIKDLLEIRGIRKPAALLLPYLKTYRGVYAGLVGLLLAGIGITLFFTWFLQSMMDAAVSGERAELKRLAALGIFFAAISGAVLYLNNYWGTVAVNGIKRDLKNDLYAHMLKLPSGFFGSRHSGDLVSRLINDAGSIDGAIGGNLIAMLRLPLMAAGAFLYLFHINWQLSLLCLLMGPAAGLSGAVFGKLLRRNSRVIHEMLAKLYSFLNDSFTGNAVVRSFLLEKHMYRVYEEQNDRVLAMELKLARLRGWFQVGAGSAGTVSFIAAISIGGYYVTQGTMTIGSLMAFTHLMQYLIFPMTGLAGLWGGFQRSVAAIERIQEVLGEMPESAELHEPRQAQALENSIEIEDITFRYEESTPLLERFGLTLPAGSVSALVGPSGAGKSTLFQLLQGFYVPQAGDIRFDGRPASRMSRSELRSYCAYVPQDTYLFTGTIRDNIAYGRLGASELEIVKAAKDANAHDFIMELPQGYDTEIGERGARLSGGQRQRIAIARAVLKDAPVLLLDEATSALDSGTEAAVREALERLMRDRTTLVIAHRLSTIHNADQIIVMDKGAIVEQGKHAELCTRNGLYARLYRLQMEKDAGTGYSPGIGLQESISGGK